MTERAETRKDSPSPFWLRTIRVVLVVLGVLGFGLLVLSILGLLGQFSTPAGPVGQHLSAADFASSAVAGATLMLAIFTAYLAIETRASVAATRREAAIAEATLIVAQDQAKASADLVAEARVDRDLNWRPYLVAVGSFPDSPNSDDIVILRNIGTGPAFNAVYARHTDQETVQRVPGATWRATARSMVHTVPSMSETEKFRASMSAATPVPFILFEDRDGKLWGQHVALFYQDLLGKRAYRLLPPRAMPDVWSPGDKVDEWVAWYFGWINLQIPNRDDPPTPSPSRIPG